MLDGLNIEGERRCDCFRFRYRRATKNIAAPYAAAPHTTPAAIPTDEARTGEELSTLPPMGAPSLTVPETEDEGELPLPGAVGAPRELSARTGIVGFIIAHRVLTLLLGWFQRLLVGV